MSSRDVIAVEAEDDAEARSEGMALMSGAEVGSFEPSSGVR